MIARYRVLAERLRAELGALEHAAFALVRDDLLAFVAFLEPLATAEEEPDEPAAV